MRHLFNTYYNLKKTRNAKLVDSVLRCVLPKRPAKQKDIKSILVVDLHLIGDIVRLTATLQELRLIYPEQKIVLLAGPWVLDILKNNSVLDDIIIYKAPWVVYQYTVKAVFGYVKLIQKLRRYQFDLGIDIRGDIRNIVTIYLSKVNRRVGFSATGGDYLLTDEVPYHTIQTTMERNRAITQYLGGEKVFMPKLWLDQEEKKRIEMFRSTHYGSVLIGISPGASQKKKQWGNDKVVALRTRLLKDPDVKLVWLLSPDDTELEDQIKKYNENRDIFLKGTLRDFILNIAKVDIYFGMDSAGAHIAAVFEKPSVICYGAFAPHHFLPLNEYAEIIYKGYDCSACSPVCIHEHRCMESIEVKEVFEKINKFRVLRDKK